MTTEAAAVATAEIKQIQSPANLEPDRDERSKMATEQDGQGSIPPLRQPNILLIMVDQQRYDCLGASGSKLARTPHLDRLVSEGVWFTEAYTHIPLCSPARQSFVNGRRPECFGGLWNYGLGLKVGALEPEEYSWARELKQQGYSSGYIGKWGVHPHHSPTAYGYDQYVDSEAEYRQFQARYYPDVRYEASYLGEVDPIPLEDSRTHWTARCAIQMIEDFTESNHPWHLCINFTEPHLPNRPAEPIASMIDPLSIPPWGSFDDTFQNKPYIQRQQLVNWGVQNYTWEDWAPIVARYYGVVSQVDDAIGRILLSLKELGLEDDTLVIYTSDHGDMCGSHRMMDKHYVLYDDVVKVPLALRWPGVIQPGLIIDQFVYNLLDLPPTLLQLLNIPLPDFFHGRSLLPLLEGIQKPIWREHVVATYNGQQFGLYTQRMIRNREWKYIWNPTDVDELYHLKVDPHELLNVIEHPEHQAVVRELREELYQVLLTEGDGLVNNTWMKHQLFHGHKL